MNTANPDDKTTTPTASASLSPDPKPGEPAAAKTGAAGEPAPTVTVGEEQVWAALRNCYDPEIPVNIVDLGLVYDVSLKGSRVDVKMTLTAPGCHLGGMIAGDVQTKILALEGVEEANVELVWDPPWHQSMITAEGRRILGME